MMVIRIDVFLLLLVRFISDCCSTKSRNSIPQQQTVRSNLSIPSGESIINYSLLTDEEILSMIKSKQLAVHNLEKYLPLLKAVHIRRLLLNEQIISTNNSSFSLDLLPYEHYDYSLVINQCCENVIGYVQLPVGYAGPLRVDQKYFYIPMATTEGEEFF
jgi:hydroxymethylglutaryl-CoA reductase (NADPH)